ncbi:MAG: UvrD-helicase domain-containing protein, partial [Gluconacetobacter diazotrophicus]|nr:UvrD-helicase domain-containing protein [Gluconacetobacter diazotrophicus]
MDGGDTPEAAIRLANRQQGMASDPDVSAFVSASAGSGKTKLLVDRLLRLMLPRPVPGDPAEQAVPGDPAEQAVSGDPAERRLFPGADPARIQCLTFTKAAAAEMAIRLQSELGRWVTMDDAALDARLAALGADGGADGPEALREPARALFARVLDLPGGMRIGTIHAFCQSLLRRFPVEAAISPHFQLVEEAEARAALFRAWEEELAARDGTPDVAVLSAQGTAADAVRLLARLQEKAPALAGLVATARENPVRLRQALRRAAGVKHDTEEECRREAVAPPDEAALRGALRDAMAAGTPALKTRAGAMADWLALDPDARLARWGDWLALFLTAGGEPRAAGGFVASKKLANEKPHIAAAMVAEAERIAAAEERCRAIRTVELTASLLAVAGPVLDRYAAAKRLRGLVDYDDLIARTIALLRDPGSAWVLFKLDGGIDHLLLDEVQDTSGLQWEIAGALTEEFFAGKGADPTDGGKEGRVLPRTVFAVGDYKQSIYSFQGADPDSFHAWHERFRDRVWDGGAQWREPELTVSFRSTVPVLRMVDAVFALPEAARGVVEPGRPAGVRHRSARPNAPGRVELWPAVPAAAEEEADGSGERAGEDDPWRAPTRNRGRQSPPRRLAERLARWIRDRIGEADPEGGAPLAPGDVLVLVPRRSGFVRALVRALKAEAVPVATLVRSGLAEQVAVQDLIALCDALLLPGDDLTLGCVLTSPLGGVTDDGLMALAAERGGASLWDRLRERAGERPDWDAAWTFLSDLFARVDFIGPHALLGEALGRLGGRARLLRRLGPEAAEPVDELLAAAQRFEAAHPPSLQGFLHWLRRSEETVKREPDSAGNAVRVMTVHGAKGLQARLVVLPDTTAAVPGEDTLLWRRGENNQALPFWVPRAALDSAPTRVLRERTRAEEAAENNRLLYVALTRAADRLLVCGWENGRKGVPEESWYALCRRGMEAAGAEAVPFAGEWGGESLLLEQGAASDAPPPRAVAAAGSGSGSDGAIGL